MTDKTKFISPRKEARAMRRTEFFSRVRAQAPAQIAVFILAFFATLGVYKFLIEQVVKPSMNRTVVSVVSIVIVVGLFSVLIHQQNK